MRKARIQVSERKTSKRSRKGTGCQEVIEVALLHTGQNLQLQPGVFGQCAVWRASRTVPLLSHCEHFQVLTTLRVRGITSAVHVNVVVLIKCPFPLLNTQTRVL